MPPLYHVRRQKSTSFAGAKKIRGNAEIGGKIACFFCADFYNSATAKSAVFFRRGTAAWAAEAIMKDLTKGNPYKLILLFALPVFIGCVFQQLYNMADTIIVGNTVGADAFTGVGKSAVTTLAGVTELAGRVLASLVFAKLWGFTGICSSNPVAWVAAVVFLVTVYYVTMRRRDAAPRARVRRLPA